MSRAIYDQSPYPCRLEWGRRGAQEAAERGDVLVIVDTLSFSTAVITAVARGGVVYPCGIEEDAAALARRVGAELAVRRREVPEKGRFSLSPLTLDSIQPGEKVVLASPNGGTCSRFGREAPRLFVGAPVNARAVAEAVNALQEAQDLRVTIVSCGERWRTGEESDALRVAIEDYLGAGAILSYVRREKSPEARVCEGAYQHGRDQFETLLWDCASGRELRATGFAEDVLRASRLNLHDAVPVLCGESFTNHERF